MLVDEDCPSCAGAVVMTVVDGEGFLTCTRDCGWWKALGPPPER